MHIHCDTSVSAEYPILAAALHPIVEMIAAYIKTAIIKTKDSLSFIFETRIDGIHANKIKKGIILIHRGGTEGKEGSGGRLKAVMYEQ
jgi:hypothetical protein